MKKLTLTLLVLALLISSCTNAGANSQDLEPHTVTETAPKTVTAEGRLLPAVSAKLAFAQGGLVDEVYASPGDKLAAGDIIARLAGSEIAQAELSASQLEQLLAQQVLDSLNRNALLTCMQADQALLKAQKDYESQARGWSIWNKDEASELELTLDRYITVERSYRAARDQLSALLYKDRANRERMNAQQDLDREQRLLAEAYTELLQTISEDDRPFNEKRTGLLAVIANLEIAREAHSRLDGHNLDTEKLAAAEARLAAATAHAAAAETALELYEVRAPFSGLLISLDLNVGEIILPGVPAAFVADNSRWIVETKDLPEIDIAKIAVGQNVTVKLDAFPGEEYQGAVMDIDMVGKEYLGDMTYQVTVALDQVDARFMWNMTATVTIETGS